MDPRSSHDRPDPQRGQALPGDHRLIRSALRGERAAVEQLVERLRCIPRILAVLNARAGHRLDDHDLADLAQDALVLVWRKLGDFREDGLLETWAYGIARYEFMNNVRRKRRRSADRAEVDDELLLAAPSPQDGLAIDAGELFKALDDLGDDDARIIRYRHDDELSFEEIGGRLSIPANTAKTRYYRGLQKLQQRLRPRLDREQGS